MNSTLFPRSCYYQQKPQFVFAFACNGSLLALLRANLEPSISSMGGVSEIRGVRVTCTASTRWNPLHTYEKTYILIQARRTNIQTPWENEKIISGLSCWLPSLPPLFVFCPPLFVFWFLSCLLSCVGLMFVMLLCCHIPVLFFVFLVGDTRWG